MVTFIRGRITHYSPCFVFSRESKYYKKVSLILIRYSVEAFARICVSGFLLDPEVPTSMLFSAIVPSYPATNIPPATSVEGSSSLSRQASLRNQNQLSRAKTFSQSLKRIQDNFAQTFALASSYSSGSVESEASSNKGSTYHARSDTVQSKTPMIEKIAASANQLHSHMRNPSQPTFLSGALRSDNSADVLSLPFRINVSDSRRYTDRNVPYLRHSWTRIDFVAIIGFWVSFALASSGVERGKYHIGIFRALSVLRTARLLAITSGTTVNLQTFHVCVTFTLTLYHLDDYAFAQDGSSAAY